MKLKIKNQHNVPVLIEELVSKMMTGNQNEQLNHYNRLLDIIEYVHKGINEYKRSKITKK